MVGDPVTLALAFAAMALAGLVRGFSGFGAAMILVPSLSVLFAPVVAVPVMSLTDSVCTLPIVIDSFRRCDWRQVLPLALSSAVTFPVGVQVLVHLDAAVLTVAIGLLVLAVTALMAAGWRYRGHIGLWATLATGATAGFLGGAIGIAGPPVILFWLAGQADAVRVRANLFAYFGCSSVISLTTLTVAGLFTGEVLWLTLILAPVFALALMLGGRLFRRADERVFRLVALGIVGLVGLAAVVSGLA
ncbi:MAG: sulfite exporter TauE/SafE family protein [Rhodospirillaceae bacterium]|nr:sulfite exporter TauE/SafE family protein [Rhodospirillaceae bacterium]